MKTVFVRLGGLVLLSAPLLVGGPAVGASEIPNFNIESTCKAAPAEGMDQKTTLKSCIADEKAAREGLHKTWKKYTATMRSNCLALATTGGLPSYVELATCLEMNEAAKETDKSPLAKKIQPID